MVRVDTSQRIHGIDALRGIAMLLGILLHATIAYKVVGLPNWPHDTSFNNSFFDFIYFLVHSFRMPLFFLIAGYFCHFLYYKIGENAFIRHRSKRILIPFLISLVLILPLTTFPFLVQHFSSIEPGKWRMIFRDSFRQLFHWNGMAHLWFLYYLLIYYTFVILLVRLQGIGVIKGFFTFLSEKIDFFRFGNYWSLIIAVIPIFLILMMVPEFYLNVDTGILPKAPYLLFYAYFFAIGWIIQKKAAGLFSWMIKNTWFFIVTSFCLLVILFRFDLTGEYERLSSWATILIKLLAACQIILMVYGSIGFFLRYCQSENQVWKYISDASYWMYLIHLSLVAGLEVLFIQIAMPGLLKFSLVLFVPVTIALITYHYWVRYTIIGKFLHGKRKKPILETTNKFSYVLFKKTI